MNVPRYLVRLALIVTILCGVMIQANAQSEPPQPSRMRSTTNAQRQAAADRLAAAKAALPSKPAGAHVSAVTGTSAGMVMPGPGGVPDYFGAANWANSPAPTVDPTTGAVSGGIRKFVNTLPGLNAPNDLGQMLPVAVPDTNTFPGSDYYEIGVVEYYEQMHSDLPKTKLRGYVQLNNPSNPATHDPVTGIVTSWPQPNYLGPIIVSQKNRAVRIKFSNLLPTGSGGDLFIPVDTSIMGAGMGPDGMNPPVGGMDYTQNRADLHLHGGATPWISDGTPHQWITPAGEVTSYPKGLSQQNVPDMWFDSKGYPVPAGTPGASNDPGPGSATYYYTNQQSARLMFYHDHSYGITRLNVYAGEAAGYLVTDPVEEDLINGSNNSGGNPTNAKVLPDLGGANHNGIPLIIQDKTFVPDPASVAKEDPTWDPIKWGGQGQLWFPHVYIPNQNPYDNSGVNPYGRWDYGPWFWPPVTPAAGLKHGEVPNPYYDPINMPWEPPMIPGVPNVSMVMEAFMDTPIVNGTAYPAMPVGRKAYRFRILNACNDRSLNLQLYYSDPLNPTEVKMVPAVPHPPTDLTWPSTWPTDGRDGGVPDPTTAGPSMIQIGTEGGFLSSPAVIAAQPVGYNYNRRDIVVLNVSNHSLFLGPAERADVIVDFSGVPDGSKVILYNDAPAPVPAFDTRLDYYTGDPDQTSTGGAPTTLAGYGPNIRTIMQFQVSGATADPAFDLNALNAAWPAAYAVAQDPIIVPEKAYGATTDTYSRIQSTSLTYTPIGATAPITTPLEPKAIQELFELDYGRMNATLGVELPLTNFNTQTTIPLGYIDPVTEVVQDHGVQIWKITHNGVDTHAMHFHLFNVQLINRVGWDGAIRPPDPNELGWKETVRMNPLEDAIVALRPIAPQVPFAVPDSIRPLDPTMPVGAQLTVTNPADGNALTVTNDMTNFGNEYVWHCHILGHEEMDMMRPMVFQTAPPAPTIGLAQATSVLGQAAVSFTPPIGTGGSPILNYTVTSSPGGVTATGTSSPINIPGLIGATPYTFTVTATNAIGTSPASAASNAVTLPASAPGAPTTVTAVAGVKSATVSFAAPAQDGGSPITSYTVTSSLGDTATGTTSPITINGLLDGTTYTFTVAATNIIGSGPASAPSNAITTPVLPGAPTAVTAVGGNGQATVNFTPPVMPADPLSQITLYTVTANTGQTATGPASGIAVTGLTNGLTYTFTVTATNAVGTGPASAPSNAVTPATIPGAPTAVSAVAGIKQATVTFTAPTTNGGSAITLYTVTSNLGDTATGTASPIVVPALKDGTTYTFTVTATNAVGVGPASAPSAPVTTPAVPGAPTSVVAVPGVKQAIVSFLAPASNGGSPITSYTVTSNTGATATGTASPITVTGLANGTSYTFTVKATNAVGTGPASAPSTSLTTAAVPGAPTAVTAARGNGQATVTFTAPANNGSPITLYTVTSNTGRTATGPASGITVTGLTNGVTYTFTVTATNAVGTGPASAASNPVTPATVPGAPTAVSALSGNGSALVSFTAPASNGGSPITSYRVTASPGGTTATGPASGITVTGLTNGTSYTFTVVATNSVGSGPASAPSAAVKVGIPAAPTGLKATLSVNGFSRSATLSWANNASNQQGFYVWRSSNGGTTWTMVGQVGRTTTTYRSGGLAARSTYTYRVQAYNAYGTSTFSNTVTVITP